MSRRAPHAASGERRGMKRSTRMSITAGIVVFLSLTSSIGFAAWTASPTKTATVSAGKVAVTTGIIDGTNTISALGPHTYTATGQTVTKPITVRNTGNVAATVRSVDVIIETTSTLPGELIDVKFWTDASTACTTPSPSVPTKLFNGNVPLNTLNITIPVSGYAILCASTTFTGDRNTDAGKSITVELAVNTGTGNWTATDDLPREKRTFTQEVLAKPNPPTMLPCIDGSDKDLITISWSIPSGNTTPNGGYNVYHDGLYLGNTTSTSTLVTNNANTKTNAILTAAGTTGISLRNTGALTVRAVDFTGAESADSAPILIAPRNGKNGLSCAN